MQPLHFRFGGGLNTSYVNPIALLALIITVILVLLLPRKYQIVPILCFTVLAPWGQEFNVGGLHLFLTRILIWLVWIRIFWLKLSTRTKIIGGRWNSVDTLFVAWAICRAIATMLLNQEAAAVINQVAFLSDALGGYFLVRFLIQDESDVIRTVRVFAVIAAIVGVCAVYERLTMHNVFALIGGSSFLQVREGSIRAQGPFEGPLLAGAFGAILLPLFLWLWSLKSKGLAIAGAAGSIAIAIASSSSTASMALAGGVVGLCFWPLRKKMKMVRWALLAGLIVLNIIMKAPVWFLIGHLEVVGGSSGSHRAHLVDEFIRHFWDWVLIGTNNAAFWGWDMWDAANQYVAEGESGGLLTFIFFIGLIARSFARIGNARRAVEGNRQREWAMWLIGIMLFVNVVAFFGISYFDQTQFVWFTLLAIISAITAPYLVDNQAVAAVLPVSVPDKIRPATPSPAPSPTMTVARQRTSFGQRRALPHGPLNTN